LDDVNKFRIRKWMNVYNGVYDERVTSLLLAYLNMTSIIKHLLKRQILMLIKFFLNKLNVTNNTSIISGKAHITHLQLSLVIIMWWMHDVECLIVSIHFTRALI
jgi:hypothetical protein